MRHSGARAPGSALRAVRAHAPPASLETIPRACRYGLRLSPLSRLGRNDGLKILQWRELSATRRPIHIWAKAVEVCALVPYRLILSIAALAAALLAAPAQAGIGAQITNFTLANGLEVVVIPDHRAPVVTHMVWYKVGSADETPGKSGLAHFLEHLMFKGTAKNPQGEFSQTVATIGGQENAFTAADYTGYFQRVPRDELKQMMEFEADRMTGLVLTDEVVRPELNVVLA